MRVLLLLVMLILLATLLGVVHGTGGVKSDMCTGDYKANGRPPSGTKCAEVDSKVCYVQSGRWGKSWCYTDTDKKNWGAECIECSGDKQVLNMECSDAGCKNAFSGLGICINTSTVDWSTASRIIDFNAGTKQGRCSNSCSCSCFKHVGCVNSECEARNGLCLIPEEEDDNRGFFIPSGYQKSFPCDASLNCHCYVQENSKPVPSTTCKQNKKCAKVKGQCFGKGDKIPKDAKQKGWCSKKSGCKCYVVKQEASTMIPTTEAPAVTTSTMIPTTPEVTTPLPHPGPGLEERLEAMEAMMTNLTNSIGTNKDNIGTNKDNIGTIKDNIGTIKDNVGNNKDNIGTNKDNIGTNKNNIGTNKDNIGTNTDNIGINKDNIGTNKDNIGTNKDNIGTNKDSIGTNTDNIGTNTDNIGTNTVNIGTNKDNIGTNKDNIGTNTDNIGTNKDNIGTNKDNIGTNKVTIGTNKDNIGTNKDNIGTNKDNIGTNKDNIETNMDNIGTNKDNIGTNKDNIGTNKDNITANTENIAKLESCLADVDSSECPISQNDKTSVVDAITANTEAIAQFHPQQAQFNLVVTGGNGRSAMSSAELITPEGVCTTSTIPPLPVSLYMHESVYHQGNLMVCGGTSSGSIQSKCYLLKNSTAEWKEGPTMNKARGWFSMIQAENVVYAIGGYGTDSIEKLIGDQWKLIPQTISSGIKYHHCAVYLKGINSMVVIGGATTNKVVALNLINEEWKDLAPLPVASLFLHRCSVIEDVIFVAGGYGPSGFQKKVFKYQHSGGSWETVGDLTEARDGFGMDVMDNKLVVVGGRDNPYLDGIESMDENEVWTKSSYSLPEKRAFHGMSAVPREDFGCKN